VIYTSPNCQGCNLTKKQFDKQGIQYEVIDISEDHDARDYVMGLGYMQAPVVVAGKQHWSGYRPHLIQGLAL
jgi:glutaredoxin-like protein NrdH